MKIDFEWNNGLIFGLAQDVIYCVETEEEAPNFEAEPDTLIMIYLGFFSIMLIFENDNGGGTPLKDKTA